MRKIEDDCVGCPQGCIHCGRDKVLYLYCDKCGDSVDTLYQCDGEELCERCILDQFETITIDNAFDDYDE